MTYDDNDEDSDRYGCVCATGDGYFPFHLTMLFFFWPTNSVRSSAGSLCSTATALAALINKVHVYSACSGVDDEWMDGWMDDCDIHCECKSYQRKCECEVKGVFLLLPVCLHDGLGVNIPDQL